VQLVERLRRHQLQIELLAVFDSPSLQAMASRIKQEQVQALPYAVVPLRTDGSRRPLFLFHPAGGSVAAYERLSRFIDADVPIYAIRANLDAFDGSVTVEDLAARYARLIRSVQAEGRYRLAGWRWGIHSLRNSSATAQGSEVEFIGLIDSHVLASEDLPDELESESGC
jgi:hypothetical protein